MSTRDRAALVLQGRIGAYVTHSRHDPRETTANGRAVFLARFEREVDPDGTLSPPERARRAEAARRAYFARLAYRSALARAARKRTKRAWLSGSELPTSEAQGDGR